MRVSIVIPTYNGQKWIRAAVQSALAQAFIAADGLPELYEVIVRDDGSTDGTLDALEGIVDKRLRVVRDPENLGLVRSFQRAFDLATTPYVTMLGQDDLLDADYLSCVMREFAEHDCAMVSCRPRFIDGDGNPYDRAGDARLNIPFPDNLPRDQLRQQLRPGNRHFGINTYLRRAVIDAGGFDEKAGWLLDWDLYLSLLKDREIRIIEKPLCSLGLRDDCTSALRLDQMPVQHRYYNHVSRKHFRPTKFKLGLATPFYMSQEYSHYGTSMIATCTMLTQAGIDWELLHVNGDSYVDRAKNTLLANFLESDCTDLLMIDSDEQWHPTAVSRLLQHPEDIVAALYPFKNNWGAFVGNPLINEIDGTRSYAGYRELADGSCLLEAWNVGGGFLRIKRAALERFQDRYSDDVYVDDYAWPGRAGRTYTQFFSCEVVNHQRYGEDTNFCRRLREMGERIWIDPNITIMHYGIKGWEGNFHQHILKTPEEIAKIQAERREIMDKLTGAPA
jgi:glycosyltransferase involved in cell wall biosynthesis